VHCIVVNHPKIVAKQVTKSENLKIIKNAAHLNLLNLIMVWKSKKRKIISN